MSLTRISLISLMALIVLFSCAENREQQAFVEVNSAATEAGYLLLENGDSIKTGTPLKLQELNIPLDSALISITPATNPKKSRQTLYDILKAGSPHKVKLKDVKTMTPGEEGIPKPKDTLLNGTMQVLQQPKPIKAENPVYKDNAVFDIQWLSIDHGLNSDYIVSFMEDSKNNIWMGTYGGGVTKYDGSEFIHYTENEGLSNNYVWSIFEDSKGNIWFGHYYGGLTKYDGYNLTHYTDENGFPSATVWSILEDKEGTLWFGTMNGLISYDSKSFTQYTAENGVAGNSIMSLMEDSQGNIWIGTRNSGLSVFNGTSFRSYSSKEGFPDDSVLSIYEDKDQTIWIGTNSSGLCKYDGESFMLYSTDEGLSHNKVMSIVEDEEDNLWFSTHGGGLNRFDGESFLRITKKDGLPNNQLRSIIVDNQNNIWSGTEGSGMFRYKCNSFSNLNLSGGLLNEQVYNIYRDSKDNLWFGTFGKGLCKYDGKDFTYYTKEQGLTAEQIIKITEDSKGNLWLGSFNNGLFKFDGERFTQFTTKSGLSSNMVWSIAEDKNGHIWFGTEPEGLTRFDGDSFTKYTFSGGFPFNTVWDIMQDHNQDLWFASNQAGLCKYNGDTFTFYTQNEGLPHNIVWCVLEDKDHNLWMGTHKGLTKYDGDSFTTYDESDGLTDNVIWSIQEDSENNIWMGTSKGINCLVGDPDILSNIDPDLKTKDGAGFIKNFNRIDGLKSTLFYSNSISLDKDNSLWLGSINGVSSLNLDRFKMMGSAPSLQLKTIDVNQQKIDYQILERDSTANTAFLKKLKQYTSGSTAFSNYPKEMQLPHDLNHLTFRYVGIQWNHPDNIMYSYTIDGLDDHWSVPTKEQKADYRNIPPGTYSFMVKAKGSTGIWSEPLVYPFSISPPWWLTKTAIFLYIFLGIVSIVGFFIWYSNRMIRKQLALEKIVNERTQTIRHQKKEVERQKTELAIANDALEKERNKMELKALLNQINPHFIFNSLNSIQQFILSNDTKSSLDYFSKFGKLMRSSLEHSELKFVSMDEEIDVIKNYVHLENLRFRHAIDLSFDTNDIDIHNVKIPPMFIQPFVENAIIHGLSQKEGERKINILFEEEEAFVNCTVTDNGIGRQKETRGSGKNSGLIITQKRLQSISTSEVTDTGIQFVDLKDSKGNALGTQVHIKLPKEFQ